MGNYVDPYKLGTMGNRYPVSVLNLGTHGWVQSIEEVWDESIYYNLKVKTQTDQIKNRIIVKAQPLLKESQAGEIYSSSDEFEIESGGQIELVLKWSTIPVDPSSVFLILVNITGISGISSQVNYAWGCKLTVTGSNGNVFQVSAEGLRCNALDEVERESEDIQSISEYGVRDYNFPENHLLQSPAVAESIANNLILSYKDNRKDVTLKKPGFTLTKVGDSIRVVEYSDDTLTTINTFYITRSNQIFNGALDEDLELRRAVPGLQYTD